jgi:hypothetical protein
LNVLEEGNLSNVGDLSNETTCSKAFEILMVAFMAQSGLFPWQDYNFYFVDAAVFPSIIIP